MKRAKWLIALLSGIITAGYMKVLDEEENNDITKEF